MSSDFDISKGKYWQRPLSLVDGCTPCSPGCDHCWSASMTHRFNFQWTRDGKAEFNGHITIRPERLSIPLKRKKPTVYSIWNDIAHEGITWGFFGSVIGTIAECPQHTFLLLTKRAERIAGFMAGMCVEWRTLPNLYCGLTVCNQQEADEKLSIFMQVPGLKWLSLEPMLSGIIIPVGHRKLLSGVVLGGETGPGARPMHPDWVRSIRDQCAAAGVPFFFKGWGEWAPKSHGYRTDARRWGTITSDGSWFENTTPWNGHDDDGNGEAIMIRAGRKDAGRLLDGRFHDDLPWRKQPESLLST